MIDGPTKAIRRTQAWCQAGLRAYHATPAGPLACRQGFVLTHAQARAAGLEDHDIRRLVRRGDWTAQRRGVCCVLPDFGQRPEILAAGVALVRPDAVISHECAALALGLDVLRGPRVATLTTCYRLHACARPDAIVRAAALDDDEVGGWFGAPLTKASRTVVDIARQGMRPGIVVADSALNNGLVTLDQLHAAVERQRRWDGVTIARHVLELASPLSESALESLTRLFLAEHNVPLPEQQVWIETYRGWYRVDGLWPDARVILEVDGLEKYRDNPMALNEEKLRQEALERAGYRVVRVTWADIHADPIGTLRRIWNALRG